MKKKTFVKKVEYKWNDNFPYNQPLIYGFLLIMLIVKLILSGLPFDYGWEIAVAIGLWLLIMFIIITIIAVSFNLRRKIYYEEV